ncbi:MAG: hypothetical protein HYT11_04600 [Candidatus Levybacteria bacterium]|nr:hypothetical protein [Candidatus Levybacteria bacterium]
MTVPKQNRITNKQLQLAFFATLFVIALTGLLWIFNQARQFQKTANQSKSTIINPTIIQDPTENWLTYQNQLLGFSFKYPPDILKLSEEVHTPGNLITKIMLSPVKDNATSMTILVWKSQKTSLTKITIESWCKNTLRGEAAAQNVLCALLSAQAITETTIFGKTLYSTKYYSSFNDQTDFFIIPQEKYVFTIHVVTPTSAKNQLPLLQILSTFKFIE